MEADVFLQMLQLYVTCQHMFVQRCSASDQLLHHISLQHEYPQRGLKIIRWKLQNHFKYKNCHSKSLQLILVISNKGYSICFGANKVI